jgi:hypothetical protein
MYSGVEFMAVDFPQANRLTVHILAAVADHEARVISERTKAAFAAAERRASSSAAIAAPASRQRPGQMWRPYRRARTLGRPTSPPSSRSYRRPAKRACGPSPPGSTKRGVSTPRGVGQWQAQMVRESLAQLPAREMPKSRKPAERGPTEAG